MTIFILEDEIHQAPRNIMLEILKDHELHVATSVPKAMKAFVGDYDLLLLDHDMHGYYDSSDKPNCGYQFVKWLTAQPLKRIPRVIIHSQNREGSLKMAAHLQECGWPHVEREYFSPTLVRRLKEEFASEQEDV